MLEEKYRISAYPTFLFIAPHGQLVYKAAGVWRDPHSFIEKMSKALRDDEQYFLLLERYNKGKRDSSFINSLSILAEKMNDEEMVQKLKSKKREGR